MTRLLALILAVLALTLAGCGLSDPYNDANNTPKHADPPTTPPPDVSEATDEQPPADTRNPRTAVDNMPRQDADAEQVATAYGLFQTNWSWRTYRSQYNRMRHLAGGALARDLNTNPPERNQLEGIRADKQTNRSTLLAADSRLVKSREARVIVAYSELAGGNGVTDDAPRATVYRAVLKRLSGRWRVIEWSRLPS